MERMTEMAEDIVLEHLNRIQNSIHDLRNQVAGAGTNTAIAAVRADVDSFRNETRRELGRIERNAGVLHSRN
jgi:hypothetical protein